MKAKYYVVWEGREVGIFNTWEECKKQIDAFPNASYKSFANKKEAENAFHRNTSNKPIMQTVNIITHSIAVDGAWNTISKEVEYQGVDTSTKKVLFHQGPFRQGTINIVEFLALVHALAYCEKKEINMAIYSDSNVAIGWVKRKKIGTQLVKTNQNAILFDLIDRALYWLHHHNYPNTILKWETKLWGENPADFNRK